MLACLSAPSMMLTDFGTSVLVGDGPRTDTQFRDLTARQPPSLAVRTMSVLIKAGSVGMVIVLAGQPAVRCTRRHPLASVFHECLYEPAHRPAGRGEDAVIPWPRPCRAS